MAGFGKFEMPRELSDSEMDHAFASCSSTEEIWIAVLQLLKEHIVQAMSDVSNPETADNYGKIAHSAGGLEYLGQFQMDLTNRFFKTHSVKSDS